jgi:[acyl-carrier-protein] S-malonyltransferase
MNIALLFAGQGVKIDPDIIKEWECDTNCKNIIEIGEKYMKEKFSELVTKENGDPRQIQFISLISSLCMYELYKRYVGIYPSQLLGHSLGEIAALTISGAIDIEEAFKLVDSRATAMKQAIEGNNVETGMMAIFSDLTEVKKLIRNTNCTISNINSEKQIVISGEVGELKSIKEKSNGVILSAPGAFHSKHMDDASKSFYNNTIKTTQFNDTCISVVKNRTADVYKSDDNFVEELALQMKSTVRWLDSMEYSNYHGVDFFVDLSPNGLFKKMFESTCYKVLCLQDIRKDKNLMLEVDSNSNYSPFDKALGIIVSQKNNNSDMTIYNDVVVNGYKEIKNMGSKENPSEDDYLKLRELVQLILITKGLSKADQDSCIHRMNFEIQRCVYKNTQ